VPGVEVATLARPTDSLTMTSRRATRVQPERVEPARRNVSGHGSSRPFLSSESPHRADSREDVSKDLRETNHRTHRCVGMNAIFLHTPSPRDVSMPARVSAFQAGLSKDCARATTPRIYGFFTRFGPRARADRVATATVLSFETSRSRRGAARCTSSGVSRSDR
jgi:hypothetical protein